MGLFTQSDGICQHLEYSIAEGLNKITKAKQKKLLLKGNGELQDILMAKFFITRVKATLLLLSHDSVAKKSVEKFRIS
jgi:hypothetical protein